MDTANEPKPKIQTTKIHIVHNENAIVFARHCNRNDPSIAISQHKSLGAAQSTLVERASRDLPSPPPPTRNATSQEAQKVRTISSSRTIVIAVPCDSRIEEAS
jgi:hypothetical protein